MIKKPIFLIGLAVVAFVAITSSWLINQSHRVFPRAAGTPEVKEAQTALPTSDIVFSQATDNLQIGRRAIVKINLQYPHPPLDGIQLVVSIRGNIPSDFAVVNSTQLSSMQLLKNILVQTDDGKQLTLLYITKHPSVPYQFPNPQGVLDIVVFSFTPTGSGSISFAVNPEKTKVIQTKTGGQNIARIPSPKTYTFVAPTPLPPVPTPIINNFTIQAILRYPDGRETTFPAANAVGITRFEEADGRQTMPRVNYASCMSGGMLSLPIIPGGTPCSRFAPGRYATQWNKTVTVGGVSFALIYPTTCSNKSCSIREQSEMITGGQPIHRGIYQAPAPKPTNTPKPTKAPKPTKEPRRR